MIQAPTARRHPVSGSVSPRSSRCFSPFPHGTGSLSVVEEYLGLEGGPPTFGQGFTCPALLEDLWSLLSVRGYHPLWPDFPDGSGSIPQATGLVRFRSSLLSESRLMSFPPGNEIFQFPGFASTHYGFMCRYPLLGGFPHSDIPGSKGVSTSPGLFAAYHVLHRLSTPRHPPDALCSLAPPRHEAQMKSSHKAYKVLPGPTNTMNARIRRHERPRVVSPTNTMLQDPSRQTDQKQSSPSPYRLEPQASCPQ